MQPHHRRAAATSAGVVYPYEYKVSADDRPLEAFAQSEAELEYFRASARSFLTRVVAVWLFATGALCIGAFFATTDTIEKLLCALGATINMVAFLHYMAITKIREGLAVWQLGYGGAEKSESGRIYKSSIEEFQVDSLRFSDWLVRIFSPLKHTTTPHPRHACACPNILWQCFGLQFLFGVLLRSRTRIFLEYRSPLQPRLS
tara:strand:+ start:1094 stop:1699 length:606 start_codon:yes stop_codon:yes gene_type:complete